MMLGHCIVNLSCYLCRIVCRKLYAGPSVVQSTITIWSAIQLRMILQLELGLYLQTRVLSIDVVWIYAVLCFLPNNYSPSVFQISFAESVLFNIEDKYILQMNKLFIL